MKRLLLLLLPLNLIAAPSPIGPRVSQTLARTADLTNYIPSAYSTVRLMGYSAAGDAPAMDLVYDPASSAPTNGINVFMPPNGVGRLIGEWDGDVRNAGVVGDGTTDDQPALQRALDASSELGIWLKIQRARYRLEAPLVFRSNSRIIGEGVESRIIKAFGPTSKPNAAIVTEGAVFPGWAVPITVTVTNIALENLVVEGLSPLTGPLLYFDGFDRARVKNVDIIGQLNQGDWAFFIRGYDFMGDGIYIDNRGAVFGDGFHVHAGSRGTLVNSIVKAGDDALVFGSSRDQGVSDWTVSNSYFESSHAHAFRIAQSTNTVAYPPEFPEITTKIEKIVVDGCVFYGGIERNAIAYISEDWPTWASGDPAPGNVNSILVSDSIFYTGDISQHEGLNAFGIRVVGTRGVTFDNCYVLNSIRSAFRIEGAIDLTLDSPKVYTLQSTSSGWRGVDVTSDFSQLRSRNVEVSHGRIYVRTNQTGIAIENTTDIRLNDNYVDAGNNAIAAGAGNTNAIINNNQLYNAQNGINTVGLSGYLTSVGNQFFNIQNRYSGSLDEGVRLDYNLEINKDDLGPLLSITRTSTTTDFSVVGGRFVIHNAAGVAFANNVTDDTDRLSEIMFFPYSFSSAGSDTNANPTGTAVRTISSATENVGNIGGGDSAQTGWTSGKLWAATNVTDTLGRNLALWNPKGITINDFGTPVIDDSAAFKVVSATRGAAPFPTITESARNSIVPSGAGIGAVNSDKGRLETYTSDGWHSAVGGMTLPLLATAAHANPSAGSTYYIGSAGSTTGSTVIGSVSFPAPRDGVVKGYWLRGRSSNATTPEIVTVHLMVNGSAVGSGSTNNFTTGAGPAYATFGETNLNVSVSAGQLIAARFAWPSPITTNSANLTWSGYVYMD